MKGGKEKKGLIKIKESLGAGWCFLESQFNTTKLIRKERTPFHIAN